MIASKAPLNTSLNKMTRMKPLVNLEPKSIGSVFVLGANSMLGRHFLDVAANFLASPARGPNEYTPWKQIIAGIPSDDVSRLKSLCGEFQGKNIQFRAFSLGDLGSAMNSCEYVLLCPSSRTDRLDQALRVVQLAQDKGIKHVFMVSSIGIDEMNDDWSIELKKIENIISASQGLKYTIVRCSIFMETLLVLSEQIKKSEISLPIGTGKFAPISIGDIANFLATIISMPWEHENAVYDLTGEYLIDGQSLAQNAGRALARPFYFDSCSEEEFELFLKRKGLPKNLISGLLSACKSISQGHQNWTSGDFMKDLTGKKSKDLTEFFVENYEIMQEGLPSVRDDWNDEQIKKRLSVKQEIHQQRHPPASWTRDPTMYYPFMGRLHETLLNIPLEYREKVLAMFDILTDELDKIVRTSRKTSRNLKPLDRDLHLLTRWARGEMQKKPYEKATHIPVERTNWYASQR